MNKEQEIEEYEPFENEDNELILDLQKSLILTKLQKKIDSFSTDNASTEFDFCELSGFVKGLKYCVEIIKNT